MEQLFKHVGKADRHDPKTQHTPASRAADMDTANGIPKQTIVQIARDLQNADELSPESAYSFVHSLTEARHDLWYEAIYSNLHNRWRTLGAETKVHDFFRLVLKIDNVPARMFNQTPDIMLYDPESNEVALGDIAVTRAEANVTAIKHEKYLHVKDEILKYGYAVIHEDFIVREDLANIRRLIQRYKNMTILAVSFNGSSTIRFTETATHLITDCLRKCTDMTVYHKIVEKSQRTKEEKMNVHEFFYPEYMSKVPDYTPHRTEAELIQMIKDKTDELGGARYYDSDMDMINKAFDGIIESNRGKRVMAPKSVLKICDNSHDYTETTDHLLISSYIEDLIQDDSSDVRDYIISMLPTMPQVKLMKDMPSNFKRSDLKSSKEHKMAGVGGRYQYKRRRMYTNPICVEFETQITKGSGKKCTPNIKKEPRTIDMDQLNVFKSLTDIQINYYGSKSNKPTFLSDDWDSYNKNEEDNTRQDRQVYNYVKATNGAQLCHSLSGLFSRLTHMSTFQGSYDNVYCPPNGSFIAMIPSEHAPVNSSNCDMPFIFITRTKLGCPLDHVEYEHRYVGSNYIYYISKLCRLNVKKISCWENAGYRLVASASYLLTKCEALMSIKEKLVGMLTMMVIDIHQKVSEYLDLLKYISFMPFSELNMLPKLISDKCNLLMKTRMDAWMFQQLRSFVIELGKTDKLEAEKPVLQLHNGKITKDSLGISVKLPSFIDQNVRHNKPSEFIEEISMIYTSRPKHLYGSQFLDESTTQTAKWNLEFDDEKEKFLGWASGHDVGPYPFDAKFCYSSDVIHYATLELMKTMSATSIKMENDLYRSQYLDYLHTNCSLRGCTKDPDQRSSSTDIHTTSIDACFKFYKKINYSEKESRAVSVAQSFLASGEKMEFSMSEKDQRGGGRPIATPTLGAKALLMAVEKPEAVMGKYMPNNIIVAGKNKLKEQYEAYTSCASDGARSGLTKIYQLTEDQTKYSENDNPTKYIPYIKTNTTMPDHVRNIQIAGVNSMMARHHLVKRLPKEINETPELRQEVIQDNLRNGVVARIGWPQGMYNYISTSVHCAADIWITKAYKIAYPNDKILTRGLVHSDDSWVTVCCDHVDTFKRFSLFRTLAKKMFCLKINEKKLWGGKYLGELVSNYNLNGNVHLSTGKVIANGLSNLTYQNWPIDVSNQISTLQQAYRQGATLGNLILLSTVLRQQIFSSYTITGYQRAHLHHLPIELGGYPSCSVFSLAVCGVHAHSSDIHRMMTTAATDDTQGPIDIITAACYMSITKHETPGYTADLVDAADFLAIELPDRGEVFSAVRHLMPKSRKISKALETIYETVANFPSDGLALIVTRPNTLAESLGHYGELVSNKLFSLASEHYTQSARRLAISQTMQSKGKVVRIGENPPMTFNEAYVVLLRTASPNAMKATAINAFKPHNDVVTACDIIVRTATLEATDKKKGGVINRMPEIENAFRTISPMQDVLLYIIDDKTGTKHFMKYSSDKTSITTVKNDMNAIISRFKHYFSYFEPKQACQLIMQAKMSTMKERAWVQPKVNTDTLSCFLEDLYGKTINSSQNYKVRSDRGYNTILTESADVVQTIYGCLVLNSIYYKKFQILRFKDKDVEDVLDDIDPANLDNNSKLKLATCQFLVNNNREYLDNFVKNEKFASKWIRTQRHHNGRYSGDWEAVFMCGSTVCSVRSINTIVTITVNKLDLRHILKGMRLFVAKCFSQHSYEYDSAWWTSRAWNSNTQPDPNATAYLCSFNSYNTSIRSEPSERYINIKVNPNLQFSDITDFQLPDDYSISDGLRVVNAITHHVDGTETSHRVGNVFQSFSIPFYEHVDLRHEYIDGFSNIDLLKSRVIEDITLSRPLSISKSDLIKLLDKCVELPMASTLWNTFVNIDRKTVGVNRNIPPIVDPGIPEIHVVEMDVETMSGAGVVDVAMTTDVESLESIATEYEVNKVRGAFLLHSPRNFLRLLCSCLHPGIQQSHILDFIYGMVHDVNLFKWMRDIHDDVSIFYDISDMISQKEMYVDYPKELFYFLYGNNMDLTKTWECVNRHVMTQRMRNMQRVSDYKPMLDCFVHALDDSFFGNAVFVKPQTAFDMLQ
uniref:RNA-directed RNA polymerase L n=1 Tax=Miglotas virus TaxID=2800927 RepID=A0A894KNG7_9VIRU|nr:MAG: RNA-dependent RNA polymerase [Miglotas virus]